ncbi:glycosyltransferase family 2 protein [Janthinobacterium sp. SUN100]|uniref:glycosyltransferase family 2 protein n=1 Tax=Janthinobacterium sp. SUN100 TaxID=3004101 RepID=UPI0025B27ACD|nr:glycosyltransferase family 2 protein [Janthinobacterium sp. SUN100]MDN2704440.1 glycosyltransferase family 2 protein [Janthinobacterium sp. SUN100]
MTVKTGLVTVLFNSASVLPGFFESLSKQKMQDYWLFIIDNSLDDRSYAKAQELIKQYDFKNVTLIHNTSNVGVAAANNQGINLSLEMGCEYVLLLNNDIEFNNPDLLGEMLTLADVRQERMIVPKIYFFDSGKIWCAGGSFNRWIGTTNHTGEGEKDTGQYDKDGHTEYAPTCFMLIHRSVFDAVGIMDEKYFVYHDDTDFVWRAGLAGYKVYYWAAGQVWHKVSSSTGGGTSPFSIYYGHRNRIYFIKKNFSTVQKIVAFTYFSLTRLLKWRLFTKKLFSSFYRGTRDGLKMKP